MSGSKQLASDGAKLERQVGFASTLHTREKWQEMFRKVCTKAQRREQFCPDGAVNDSSTKDLEFHRGFKLRAGFGHLTCGTTF